MTTRKVVVFDWDGTLYDSEGLLEIAAGQVLKALGIPLSEPIAALLTRPVEGVNLIDSVASKLSGLQTESFRTRTLIAFALLERAAGLKVGMPQILDSLHREGVVMCVATGRSRQRFEADIQKLKLQGVFAVTVCAGEGKAKPDADCLLHIMRVLNAKPRDCIFVGDSQADEQCANAASVAFIGARIDYRTGTALSGFSSTTAVATAAVSVREMLSLWIARAHGESDVAPLCLHDSLKDKANV
ncbi:Phosphoglycolate phosphatase [compost metagenome]